MTENNLKLKTEKSRFFQTEVSFLGQTVTPNCVNMDNKTFEAIQDWLAPRNVKDLRRLLRLTGYMRKCVPHYAQRVNPISDLLKGYSNKRGSHSVNKKARKRYRDLV